MSANHKIPGLYVREEPAMPAEIADVQSAIPAFIGFTERALYNGRDLTGVAEPVSSFKDFEDRFGKAAPVVPTAIAIRTDADMRFQSVESVSFQKRFFLYESVSLYFQNGGGPCFVVSIGNYETAVSANDKDKFLAALQALEAIDDVTLLVMPEAVLLKEQLPTVQQAALRHCADCGNRFGILDIAENAWAESDQEETSLLLHWTPAPDTDAWGKSWRAFRDSIGIANLAYGAAYTPYVVADIAAHIRYEQCRACLVKAGGAQDDKPGENLTLAQLDPDASALITALEDALSERDTTADADGQPSPSPTDDQADGPPSQSLADEKGTGGDTVDSDREDSGNASSNNTDKNNLKDNLLSSLCALLQSILQLGIKRIHALIQNSPSPEKSSTSAAETPPDDNANSADTNGNPCGAPCDSIQRLTEDLAKNSKAYQAIVDAVTIAARTLPPSAAIAGIYAATDNQRGIWKAPANVSLSGVTSLSHAIDAQTQEMLNSDPAFGKSINALRAFPDKGILVWGTRTLDANSAEWRYIPTRRFVSMIEESIRRFTAQAVFKPNDASLWIEVKIQIDNYLLNKWKEGALMGAAPDEAFFVNTGLGQTMTAEDILGGRLLIDIGLAITRPAEFIVLRIEQKTQKS